MSILKSKGVKWIGLGWTGFILENLILSHNREEIINNFGSDKYHLVYNTLSTAACSSIAWGYFKHGRKTGPTLSGRSKLALTAGFLLQTVGFMGLSQLAPKLQMPVQLSSAGTDASTPSKGPNPSSSPTQPVQPVQPSGFALRVRCPMDFKPKDVPVDGIYGVERVSRHSVFWAMGMAALGQACYTLFIPEIVMFSFPMIFAAIGTEHQDYRYRRHSGGVLTPQTEAVTSNVPFAALITGKQSWRALADEIKWTNAGVAALGALMLFLKRI